MDEIWMVHQATPADVIAWLQNLANLARLEQKGHRYRSRVTVGDAGAVDVAMLPLPTRSRSTDAGAIYARPPSPERPFGELLVLALIAPEPPLQSYTPGRGIVVELASDPRFPLMGDEVTWHFTQRFPQLRRLESGRRAGTLLWINRMSRTPSTGAPVLACNLWLEEQLLRLEEPHRRRSLFKPWLERYRAERGTYPADPMRSFRAALAGCERRLHRRTREAGPPAASATESPPAETEGLKSSMKNP